MENDEAKKISADHSQPAFFADALTVSHTEDKFVIDFTQTTPRFDQVGGDRHESFTIKHRTVMTDPQLAKVVLNVLQENVEKYEEEHGEIEVPDKQPEEPKEEDVTTTTNYIG